MELTWSATASTAELLASPAIARRPVRRTHVEPNVLSFAKFNIAGISCPLGDQLRMSRTRSQSRLSVDARNDGRSMRTHSAGGY
eukprot:772266-Pyramimonas_sp.AAC.1